MRRLVLAERAYTAIAEDCLAHLETETGGLLIGRRTGNRIIVPFAIPGGLKASRTQAGFAPDSAWQQTILDYLFNRFGLDYVGDYHKHPSGIERPSAIDRMTARAIVTDPAWGKSEALFPIVTVEGTCVRLRSFLMTRVCGEFSETAVDVVGDRHRRMRALLLRAKP